MDILTKKKPVWVQGKVIGYMVGVKFIKPVYGSKHQLRSPRAWAIDSGVFESEIKGKAHEIVIIDKETSIDYRCTVEVFDQFKGKLNRGYGAQYFLPLDRWMVAEKDIKQLSLFGDEKRGEL